MTAQGDRGEPFGRPKQEVAYGLHSLPSARLLSLGPRLPLEVEPHPLAGVVETDGCLDNKYTCFWLACA